MKVLWCWSRISGYMAAGWRALDSRDDIDLKLIAWSVSGDNEVAFDSNLVEGLDCCLLTPEQRGDFDLIWQRASEFDPDVIVVPGWISPAYCRLAKHFSQTPVVMTMDTPWRGDWRQWAASYRLGTYLRRVDHVVVAGERAWQYARRLGFRESQLHRGLYTYDEDSFSPAAEIPEKFPTGFVFVGRYAPEKGLGVLLDAYAEYRKRTAEPWTLTCAGRGPLQWKMSDQVGVKDVGFVAPTSLPMLYRENAAMILPSLYEPWGVALAEAMASGRTVIASEACGAAIDLIRSFFNGLSVPTDSRDALANAMSWVHEHTHLLPEMGSRAAAAAIPFGTSAWAVRWRNYLKAAATHIP